MSTDYKITTTSKKAVVGEDPSHLEIVSLEVKEKALLITEDKKPPKIGSNAGTFKNKASTVHIQYHSEYKYHTGDVFREKTWQKRAFIGARTAYIVLSFWPFYEYLYLVWKYSSILIYFSSMYI